MATSIGQEGKQLSITLLQSSVTQATISKGLTKYDVQRMVRGSMTLTARVCLHESKNTVV